MVFLVSDFMTDEDLIASKELSMLAARHDVIAVVPEDSCRNSIASRPRIPQRAGLGVWQARRAGAGKSARGGAMTSRSGSAAKH